MSKLFKMVGRRGLDQQMMITADIAFGEPEIVKGSLCSGHQPACLTAHNLIGKVSIILGNCDLLIEKMEAGTEESRRLAVIRETPRI